MAVLNMLLRLEVEILSKDLDGYGTSPSGLLSSRIRLSGRAPAACCHPGLDSRDEPQRPAVIQD